MCSSAEISLTEYPSSSFNSNDLAIRGSSASIIALMPSYSVFAMVCSSSGALPIGSYPVSTRPSQLIMGACFLLLYGQVEQGTVSGHLMNAFLFPGIMRCLSAESAAENLNGTSTQQGALSIRFGSAVSIWKTSAPAP